MPHDLYYNEWTRRKLRNKVHLNHGGCLGPCALANVAMLLFDGRPIWFHSLNDERLILAIFDYIESMLAADGYLPAPAVLVPHVFNGFAWDGEAAHSTSPGQGAGIRESGESADAAISRLKDGILMLSHADTDLLALAKAQELLLDEFSTDFPTVQGVNILSLPTVAHVESFIERELADVQVLVLRSLGGRQGFAHGFDRIVQAAERLQIDLICVPGTEGLDPELTASSSVPVPVIHDVYRYLHFGGVENVRQMVCFLADHLMAGGWGYEQPVEMPRHGGYGAWSVERPVRRAQDKGASALLQETAPQIGILFYRSHYLSGNTDFVDALVAAIEDEGGEAVPVFTTSLKELGEGGDRPAAFEFFYDDAGALLVDVVISTISFAMGGINNEGITSPSWNVESLEALGVPVVQAITSGMQVEEWQISQRGLRPLDVAMNVALPEFDGRIISVPISFKGVATGPGRNQRLDTENTEDAQRAPRKARENRSENISGRGGTASFTKYIPVPDRVEAVARQVMRLASLRRKSNAEKRVAFVFTNSPGKADRIGNAVGLDTPASLLRLFARMKEAGYQIDDVPDESDALLHALIERCSYDETILTEAQLADAAGRVPVERYEDWFAQLTEKQQAQMSKRWGDPPGEAYVHTDWQGVGQHLALAGLEFGNAFVALQPPRGYGMDPDAIYHTPDLPPTHNYFALYKWLSQPQAEGGWGADAIVHMGKHGTLEWLPGKGIGLSEECFPDTFLDDMPLVYPFIINNPGEGAQAKRRAHAVVVDHMIPPMTSADVYGELASLTQLVDEYYQVEQMDPAKLPLVQKQIWDLMEATNLSQDIAEMISSVDHGDHTHEWDGSFTEDGTPASLAEMSGTEFAHLLEDIDGYLCELGSLQIRDGLHILGHIPEGDQLANLLRALTRIPNGDVPSLRAAVAEMLGFELELLLAERGKRFSIDDLRFTIYDVGVAIEMGSPHADSGEGPLPSPPPDGGGGHEQKNQVDVSTVGPLPVGRVREGPRPLATHADAIELVDELCLALLQWLEVDGFRSDRIDLAIDAVFRVRWTSRRTRHGCRRSLVCLRYARGVDSTERC